MLLGVAHLNSSCNIDIFHLTIYNSIELLFHFSYCEVLKFFVDRTFGSMRFLTPIYELLGISLLLHVEVYGTDYKYDPNSIPHISTQKLKNIISSGNDAVLVYFCKFHHYFLYLESVFL